MKIPRQYLKTTLFFVMGTTALFLGALFAILESTDTASSSASIAEQAYQECGEGQNGGKETCYARFFKDVAYEHGARQAFTSLRATQALDPAARGCHFIAHGIGNGVYERDPKNWRDHLHTIPGDCSYGAPMGVVEMYVGTLPYGTLTKEFIPTICGQGENLQSCWHMVGHVLLMDAAVEGDVDKALSLCESLRGDYDGYYQCLSGVFMEHITAFGLIDHGYADGSWLNWPARVPDLRELCLSHEGDYAKACWEEIAHAVAVKFHGDGARTFAFCDEHQNDEFARACVYHAIGIIAGMENFNIDRTASLCEVSLDEHYGFPLECQSRLVGSTLVSIPEKLPEAVSYCLGLGTSAERESCFEHIGQNTRLPMFGHIDVEGVCAEAEEYEDLCRGEGVSPVDDVVGSVD